MKRVLMVAFHFPPLSGTSGVQRTLRFARDLPRFGWEPLVLTAHPMAYASVAEDLSADVPPGLHVERALALDAARHLAILGRYPAALARPDRWTSWRFFAMRRARSMLQKYRPQAIWSTYPIATAHVIGGALAEQSGLPWVADFRDPMAQDGYPSDPKTWRAWAAIERHALEHAASSVFTAPGAVQFYQARYPHLSRSRFEVIENGYDEASFSPASSIAPLEPGTITLLHSGVIYPSERDPRALLAAVAAVARRRPARFRLRLRAPGHEAWLRQLIVEQGVSEVVECAPPLAYREALDEMQRADGLLVMQAASCNAQIPAKLYEYLRAGRPILALTARDGDTAGVMRAAHAPGQAAIAELADRADIERGLESFLSRLEAGCAPRPLAEAVARADRSERARELAQVLDHACLQPAGAHT